MLNTSEATKQAIVFSPVSLCAREFTQ